MIILNPKYCGVKVAEKLLTEIYSANVVTDFFKANVLANKCRRYHDPIMAPPADCSIAANLEDLELFWIVPRKDRAVEPPGGGNMNAGRRDVAQGLVRTQFIVFLTERVKPALLDGKPIGGRTGRFRLELAVHSLMAAVLLGMSWI